MLEDKQRLIDIRQGFIDLPPVRHQPGERR